MTGRLSRWIEGSSDETLRRAALGGLAAPLLLLGYWWWFARLVAFYLILASVPAVVFLASAVSPSTLRESPLALGIALLFLLLNAVVLAMDLARLRVLRHVARGRSTPFDSMVDRFNAWVEHASNLSLRLASVGGLLATLALMLLGALPSYYTFIAIFAVVSPFLFLANIVRPSFLREWHGLRGYAVLCVFLAVAVWLFQIVWTTFRLGSL